MRMRVETRTEARALSGTELEAALAEALGLPVVWSSDPYYPPRHPGRMPYLKGEHEGVTYDWASVPRWFTGEETQELLDQLYARGFSWSASGVPIISSAQQGTIVLLKRGLRPPENREDADAEGRGLTFASALVRAALPPSAMSCSHFARSLSGALTASTRGLSVTIV